MCDQRPGRLELLPDVLAQCCVTVLGVSGAGISMMMEDLRVPLGSSDQHAARAEQLQVTLGEGPCLDAVAADHARVFDLPALAERWPAFHGHVVAQTPFRAIASLPIRSTRLPAVGALDLYSTCDGGLDALAYDDIDSTIVGTICQRLFEAPGAALEQGSGLPLWLGNDAVSHRMDVWVAVGTLMELAALTRDDALAVIRSYARQHAVSLDQVAHRIAEEQLPPEQLLA